MRRALAALMLLASGCGGQPPAASRPAVDAAAERYVRLALALGERDADSIDSYHGPSQWQADAGARHAPLPKIRADATLLADSLAAAAAPDAPRDDNVRRAFLVRQLRAIAARVDILLGARPSFDDETRSLFGLEGQAGGDGDAAAVGLRTASRPFTRFGAALLDFDNDGLLDLYEANGRVGRQSTMFSADPYAEPNLLFRGVAGPRFEEVTPRGGTAALLVGSSRAAAFGDIDNDGGLDIVVVNRDARAYVLRNVVAGRGHWAMLRMVDDHGRDALGAEVTMTVAGRTIRRDVRAAYSYLASNDPRVHVGLGSETVLRDVSVLWPTGKRERFGDVAADKVAVLRQGIGRM